MEPHNTVSWKRPKDVQHPRVWLRFVSAKTGQKFVVKDLSAEYYDIALGYMTNMFLEESVICKPLQILAEPVARGQMQRKWLAIMQAGMAVVCVTDDELPRVAGVHLTAVRERNGVEAKESSTDQSQYMKFSKVVQDLKNEGQLFDHFGCEQYLGSLGLFVLPEFRGLGIATEILKARLVMCEALGLRGTATVFSTAGAQAAARKAGYEVLATRTKEQCDVINLQYTLAVMGKAVTLSEYE